MVEVMPSWDENKDLEQVVHVFVLYSRFTVTIINPSFVPALPSL
jgi:hypothetical protein